MSRTSEASIKPQSLPGSRPGLSHRSVSGREPMTGLDCFIQLPPAYRPEATSLSYALTVNLLCCLSPDSPLPTGEAGPQPLSWLTLARNGIIPNPCHMSSGYGRDMSHVAEKPPDFVAAILKRGEAEASHAAPRGSHGSHAAVTRQRRLYGLRAPAGLRGRRCGSRLATRCHGMTRHTPEPQRPRQAATEAMPLDA